MGIVIRQSIKTTAVSYIGFAIGYINSLFLFPLVLSKEQIGLTRLPYFRDEKKQHNGILAFVLSIGMIGFVLFVIVFFLSKNVIFSAYSKNSPLLLDYYFYFIWGIHN